MRLQRRWRPLTRWLVSGIALLICAALFFAGYYFYKSIQPHKVIEDVRQESQELFKDSDVLFGAATIALTLVTFILAIMAFVGWIQIRETIEDRVDQAIEIELSALARANLCETASVVAIGSVVWR